MYRATGSRQEKLDAEQNYWVKAASIIKNDPLKLLRESSIKIFICTVTVHQLLVVLLSYHLFIIILCVSISNLGIPTGFQAVAGDEIEILV